MLVSWNWLSRYVDLKLPHDELVDRLSLSGLNHEFSENVDGDTVIDLEVTSNRGDCLGHIGVAREIAVQTDQSLRLDPLELVESSTSINSQLTVCNQFSAACPRYTARMIRNVKVGPSPEWMIQSLHSIGLKSINNVVDITNYVMMECGQPLHAFDAAKIGGQQINVRAAKAGEEFLAIDHKKYVLHSNDCVIADANAAIAIAGVMGGADSEVDTSTVDVVLEAAVFAPLSIRRTARRLKLHSPSSFRFERRVDLAGVDWASRRACQLILELAGGHLCQGVIDTDPILVPRSPVVLRPIRISQVLGIDISTVEVDRILSGLGCKIARGNSSDGSLTVTPPSWRHDLTREIDLIEEVARIHGYDKIPENSPIPVAPSSKRSFDVGTSRIRSVLTAAGFSESMTPSVVTDKVDQAISPWTERPALQTRTAMLVGSRTLRRSLLPSLLASRAANHASASLQADLFEIAHVYLPPEANDALELPTEAYHLGIIAGDDFFALKGVLEALLVRLGIQAPLSVKPVDREGFARGMCVGLSLGDETAILGYLGSVSPSLVKQAKLPNGVTVAELSLEVFFAKSSLVPQQRPISPFPSIRRDLNLIVPEAVRWVELASLVRSVAGERLNELAYQETYRNELQDGASKKRLLFSMELQSQTETLSGTDADAIIDRVVRACETKLQAILMR